jgi:hypothetical protein
MELYFHAPIRLHEVEVRHRKIFTLPFTLQVGIKTFDPYSENPRKFVLLLFSDCCSFFVLYVEEITLSRVGMKINLYN